MSSLQAVTELTSQARQMVRHPLDLGPTPITINKTTEALIGDIEIIDASEEERLEQSIVTQGTEILNDLGSALLNKSGQLIANGVFSLIVGLSIGAATLAPEYLLRMGEVPAIIKGVGAIATIAGTSLFILDSYFALRYALIGSRLDNFRT